jgi:hypothetical protein
MKIEDGGSRNWDFNTVSIHLTRINLNVIRRFLPWSYKYVLSNVRFEVLMTMTIIEVFWEDDV